MDGDEENKAINRRKFLTYVVAGSAGLIAASVAIPLAGYFLSPVWMQSEEAIVPITPTSRIPVGTPTFIRFEERVPDGWLITTESAGLWVLTKDGKTFTVFDPHCTHLNCPFEWDAKQNMFVCPCHGGRFDIDGKVVSGPPPRPLDKWEFIIQDGEIEVTGKIIRG